MKFLVVGVGAIGGAFLAFLSRAGYECAGLVKGGKVLDLLQVEGIWGSFTQKVQTISRVEELDFTPDLILISVKSYDTEAALKSVSELVDKGSRILIAQNGYGNYEKASRKFGKEKVLLSRIIFGSEVVERGRIRITVCADDVIIGDPSRTIEESFIRKVAERINSAGIPTRYDPRVYEYLWAKIIYNCALNPLGALLEVNYGWLADDPGTRSIMDGIIDEIFNVLEAHRIKTLWDSPEEFKEAFYGQLIPPTRDHYPSMLGDIKKGKTEIDALNGAVVRLGQDKDIPTPFNEVITQLVKAKERSFSNNG